MQNLNALLHPADLEFLLTAASRSDENTPAPVSLRLMKAPAASHPLPQGGEGTNLV